MVWGGGTWVACTKPCHQPYWAVVGWIGMLIAIHLSLPNVGTLLHKCSWLNGHQFPQTHLKSYYVNVQMSAFFFFFYILVFPPGYPFTQSSLSWLSANQLRLPIEIESFSNWSGWYWDCPHFLPIHCCSILVETNFSRSAYLFLGLQKGPLI